MSATLRGPHHHIGVATAVTDIIFRHLHAICEAQGGSLSLGEIDIARSHIMRGYPGAFGCFEATHQRCMEASAATAPDLFAHDKILTSLLFHCSHKAARPAFPSQIGRFGDPWLHQFFGGLAQFAREHVCANADDRLIQVYAEVAVKHGAKLTMTDLVHEKTTRDVLQECVAPLVVSDAPAKMSARLSDVVSQSIAAQRGIPKPDVSKVIEQEMKNFLVWLPRQIHVVLTGPA